MSDFSIACRTIKSATLRLETTPAFPRKHVAASQHYRYSHATDLFRVRFDISCGRLYLCDAVSGPCELQDANVAHGGLAPDAEPTAVLAACQAVALMSLAAVIILGGCVLSCHPHVALGGYGRGKRLQILSTTLGQYSDNIY